MAGTRSIGVYKDLLGRSLVIFGVKTTRGVYIILLLLATISFPCLFSYFISILPVIVRVESL